MDLRMIILILVTMYKVELVLGSQPRASRVAVKPGKCDMEFYFDPNLGENGRCQPCNEICAPNWGTEDQCLENIDQCRGTYDRYHPTTTTEAVVLSTVSTPTGKSEKEPGSQTILIVAISTGLIALMTTVLLAIYLYKRHRTSLKNCCRSCVNRPHIVKPVDESSLHRSRDRICVSNVNIPPSSAGQALLSKNLHQEESTSLQSRNQESVV